MTDVLSRATRTARNPHWCFHCRCKIMPGETYLRHVYKHDRVYALCFHPDCEAFDQEYRAMTGEAYGEDGWGPLLDDLLENGDYEAECAAKQDKYPDVIRRFRQALTTRRP